MRSGFYATKITSHSTTITMSRKLCKTWKVYSTISKIYVRLQIKISAVVLLDFWCLGGCVASRPFQYLRLVPPPAYFLRRFNFWNLNIFVGLGSMSWPRQANELTACIISMISVSQPYCGLQESLTRHTTPPCYDVLLNSLLSAFVVACVSSNQFNVLPLVEELVALQPRAEVCNAD